MRYVYIKNGDAIEQIELLSRLKEYPRGGPNAFIGELLQLVADNPILILSCAARARNYSNENIEAKVYNWRSLKSGRIVSMLKRFVATLGGGIRMLRFRPDVVICGRTGGFLWAGFIVAVLLRVPFIHSRHNRVYWPNTGTLKRIAEFIDVRVIRRASAVLVHGPYLAQQVKDIGVAEDRVFEFDQKIDDFSSNDDEAGSPAHQSDYVRDTLLFVGRIEEEKGIFDLLEAVRKLHGSGVKVNLVYVGKGADAGKLETRIQELELSTIATVKGVVDHSQLPRLMNQSAAVVTPTRSSFPEGRCMVVMEAFAVGVPVVGPLSGPFPYLIKDGVNGLLFDTDSVDSLHRVLKSLFEDDELSSRLAQGAKLSGEELMRNNVTFGQSLSAALSRVRVGSV